MDTLEASAHFSEATEFPFESCLLAQVEKELLPEVTDAHIQSIEHELKRMQDHLKSNRKGITDSEKQQRAEWVDRMQRLLRRSGLHIEVRGSRGIDYMPVLSPNGSFILSSGNGNRGFVRTGKLIVVRDEFFHLASPQAPAPSST